MTLSADFSATPDRQHGAEIQRLCDAMEAADQAGRYPQLTVERPWSAHNPVLVGEFAAPKLSADAQNFYAASRRQHVEIAISVTEKVRQLYPGGLPAADLRSADEPLLGTTDPEPTQAPLYGPRKR